MSAKVEDRRVKRTRAVLRDALMELILEKGYEAITVQDITDRANVGRSTFYTHFLDKQALLETGLEELHEFLAQQLVVPAAANGTNRRALSFSLSMFQHAEGHRRIYRAMVDKQSGVVVRQQLQRVLTDLVREDLRALVPSTGSAPVPLEVAVQYSASAFLGLLTWWLDQKVPCPPEEMDRLFRSLTLPGITAALNLPAALV